VRHALPVPHVQVSATIQADARVLYRLVSDVTSMGRWSPENTGGRWLGGADAAVVGARFRGDNRHGWRRWSTLCTVTDAEPGRRFGFHVRFGPYPISQWTYEFDQRADATVVTESWTDLRPGWMRPLSAPVMGIRDRAGHNRTGMQATLDALRRAAETSEG
jgi:hypothetical protein